ncbi:MAG: DUF188 domain-containing protein, partial [Victivallaceae bacterium]
MKIYVDSDAMPRRLKEAVFQVAARTQIEAVFVAAHIPRLPECEFVRCVGAGGAFDGADDWIVEHV